MSVDLFYAFGLPPEKAVEYFRSKGYEFSWDWFEIWQEAHDKAFTVAKVMKLDVLQDIRDLVDKSLADGMSYSDFRSQMRSLIARKGWPVEGGVDEVLLNVGSNWRVRTIYETNLQVALNAGRYREMMENVANRPYWQYIAVMDSRTRPAHAILNGKAFRYDDPIWKAIYPPNGWGCRCRVRALTAAQVKAKGLTVESSAGRLATETKYLDESPDSGVPVTVYTDPVTGKKVSPDPGWNYNPGSSTWEPDLSKYDKDIAGLY